MEVNKGFLYFYFSKIELVNEVVCLMLKESFPLPTKNSLCYLYRSAVGGLAIAVRNGACFKKCQENYTQSTILLCIIWV